MTLLAELGGIANPPVEPWQFGGAAGVLVGLGMAHVSSARPVVHQALQRGGMLLCLLLPLAAVMFAWAEAERRSGGFLAGMSEVILGFLCLFLGIAGVAFLLAGISGKKLLTA
jgi:hypothetical protein